MDILHSETEWESSSDSGSSSDDAEELDFLYGGKATDILSSLEESIGKIDDFLKFERGFVHGDIVCSVTDPSGQMGRVISVQMSVDLENFSGKIIKGVDSKNLLKVRSISVGDFVVHGPWIGRVIKVVDKITVLFDDGTKCEVTAINQEKLMPISPHSLDDIPYPYFPGQRVQLQHPSPYKSARWLCGTSREIQYAGTVSAVEAGLVYVDWLASALVGCDWSLAAPQRLQNAENIIVLPCFPHENWQLGDWCIYPKAGCKGVKEQIITDRSVFELIKEKNTEKAFESKSLRSNLQDVYVIVKTKTIVDVEWQDGTVSIGLDSLSIVPVNVVNSHEFWPGQFVLEKGACDDPNVPSNQNWGVVVGVGAKERTVRVQWKSASKNQTSEVEKNLMAEIVSAYELDEHPDYSYCFGDIVFKNANQINMHNPLYKEESAHKGIILMDKDCIDNNRNSKAFLSHIGCVVGFKDGFVVVMWASGVETNIAPDDIFRIDKSEGSASSPVQDSTPEELDQEMLLQDEVSTVKENDWLNTREISKEYQKIQPDSSSQFFPQFVAGFFTNIAASLFGSFVSMSRPTPISSEPDLEEPNFPKTLEDEEILKTCDFYAEMTHAEMQPLVSSKMEGSIDGNLEPDENVSKSQAFKSVPASKSLEQFSQFDMVGDCSDHYFLDVFGKGLAISQCHLQVKRGWLKKVQQEWSILGRDLPELIYVRTFEERMDLLRAAIIGSPGTPYHDGVFFFDIYLPPQYPYEPPLVHYISCGLRVNPNLYESGKICLSLLNTWAGTGTEVWNPERSNVLQVLLSLQALVLNEKPFFNEAGYDKQMGKAEGEKNSVCYNENVFLLTWKSMLYLLHRPPKHFEALLEEHLERRSKDILSACKAYMEGAPIAHTFGNAQDELENQKGSSTGFKLMLAKLFPKLVEAFSGKGIDCSQFAEPHK